MVQPSSKNPYAEMKEEIQKIDQMSRRQKQQFGFMTSYSDKDASDEELDLGVPLGKENSNSMMFETHSEYATRDPSSAKKQPRKSSLIRKTSSKRKPLPFRSSAGFGNKSQKTDLTNQTSAKKKTMRAGSARRKLPPPAVNKEKLNELKEHKMTQEKDRIMDEFTKIVSKTSTSFKEPKFPNSTRKQVLQPIRPPSKGSAYRTE
jgi:hypothetical protein